MTAFPVLYSAMLRHLLDIPLNIWSICYFDSFGAYGATRILFVLVVWVQAYLLSLYTCTLWLCVCLCFYVRLGVCRCACADYVLWRAYSNGWWTLCMYLGVRSLPVRCNPLTYSRSARSLSWFLRLWMPLVFVISILLCRALLACYISTCGPMSVATLYSSDQWSYAC